MRNLILLFVLISSFCFTATAQLATLEMPETAKELLIYTEAAADKLLPPASEELLEELTTMNWIPLDINQTWDRITCAWGDGLGGSITCPPGAVGCAVFANATTAAIGCIDAGNRVVGEVRLYRDL
jgi:hypothetical protein